MQKHFTIIGIVVLSLLAGAFISEAAGWPDFSRQALEEGDDSFLPAALSGEWFPPLEDYDNGGELLADELFERLMEDLDVAMNAEETQANFGREAVLHLSNFAQRLVIAELTAEQQERVTGYLAALDENYPEHRDMIGQQRILLAMNARPADRIMGLSMWMQPFNDAGHLDPEGELFEDRQVEEIIGRVDAILNHPEAVRRFERDGSIPFYHMVHILRRGRLTPQQTERVVTWFDEWKERHPEGTEFLDEHRYQIANLLPGQVAQSIAGKDAAGVEFSLEEYRGKVVVLVFSGYWCGPCHAEYPYQRAMMELYADQPIALLEVNSDESLDTLIAMKEQEGLTHRAWWDGHVEGANTDGPITSAWRVNAWPTTFILDKEGVIRKVSSGAQRGKTIVAVDELLLEYR